MNHVPQTGPNADFFSSLLGKWETLSGQFGGSFIVGQERDPDRHLRRRRAGRRCKAPEAAAAAGALRLRPVLMTARSFIRGALPLAFASGAGDNA